MAEPEKICIFSNLAIPIVVDLRKWPATIGRVPECTLNLNCNALSRIHAQLELRDGKVVVVDLKSTNGVFVGEDYIAGPTPVPAGEPVYLADEDCVIWYEECEGDAVPGTCIPEGVDMSALVLGENEDAPGSQTQEAAALSDDDIKEDKSTVHDTSAVVLRMDGPRRRRPRKTENPESSKARSANIKLADD